MSKENLQRKLNVLHRELENVDSVDSKTKDLLKLLLNDIDNIIKKGSNSNTINGSPINKLESYVVEFEDSHPSLSSAIRNIINTLNNMGI